MYRYKVAFQTCQEIDVVLSSIMCLQIIILLHYRFDKKAARY